MYVPLTHGWYFINISSFNFFLFLEFLQQMLLYILQVCAALTKGVFLNKVCKLGWRNESYFKCSGR